LLAAIAAVFSIASPRFFTLQNVMNILVQSSSLGILAAGMTFVLLTGGIDLSVGSIMFLSAAVAAKLALAGVPLSISFSAALVIGVGCGLLNALFIVHLKLLPFIVTLAALYVERGFALYLTATRAMNLPESILRLGAGRLAGIPLPIWFLSVTLIVMQLILSGTPFGRRIYACGHDVESARLAGVNTRAILTAVYMISGFCAAFGGVIAVAQLGAVSPTFGYQREFAAIAAAALGGASLFGGRGSVLPGALAGTLLIQTVESGLVIVNADPYFYPMVMAVIILLSVVLDALRRRYAANRARRSIRPVDVAA
jgi:ribose transport system permease protein